jgi:hypothetical protein
MAVPMTAAQLAAANTVRDKLGEAEASVKTARIALGDAVSTLKTAYAGELDGNRPASALDAFEAMGQAMELRGLADELMGTIIRYHVSMSRKLSETFTDASTTIQGGGAGRRNL